MIRAFRSARSRGNGGRRIPGLWHIPKEIVSLFEICRWKIIKIKKENHTRESAIRASIVSSLRLKTLKHGML
jgi:hypothetical protein